MKIIPMLLLIFITNFGFCFNYSRYAAEYINKVEGTKVGNGVCMELVQDLFSEIKDSMLVDTERMIWGSPIDMSSEIIRTGDIIIFANHIGIALIKKDGLYIVDQNSNGDSNGVEIYPLEFDYIELENFQIFRPIELETVPLVGHSKEILLRLYTIHISDRERMGRSNYDIPDKKYYNQYIIDIDIEWTKEEYIFAKYFKGKVYNNIVRTPEGNILVERIDMYLKPIKFVD